VKPEGPLSCRQKPANGPYPEPSESSTHHTLKTILILSFNLRLWLPTGLWLSDFSTKILYAVLISYMSATCLANLMLLDLTILLIYGEEL
jgi:hypothetical protein